MGKVRFYVLTPPGSSPTKPTNPIYLRMHYPTVCRRSSGPYRPALHNSTEINQLFSFLFMENMKENLVCRNPSLAIVIPDLIVIDPTLLLISKRKRGRNPRVLVSCQWVHRSEALRNFMRMTKYYRSEADLCTILSSLRGTKQSQGRVAAISPSLSSDPPHAARRRIQSHCFYG